MDDWCWAGVLDLIGAGVLVHTVRTAGPTTPNAAILGVSYATPAAVWPPHRTIEQSHWSKRGYKVNREHYSSKYEMNALYTKLLYSKQQLSIVQLCTAMQTHHTDPQRCQWGSCFFSSHWLWLGTPPARPSTHTETRRAVKKNNVYKVVWCKPCVQLLQRTSSYLVES